MTLLRDPGAAAPQRRRVLVTRAIDPAVIEVLRAHVELSLNSDDADWSQLELIERLQGHWGALVTVGERIDAALLDACPELRAVCSLGVGVNNIDIAACTARGVVVTNAPDVLTETTADLGFALMMAAARRVGESERFLRQGAWTRWSCDFFTGMEVHGATLGILGMGRIGQAVARRGALGFGMPVIYHNRNPLPAEMAEPLGARWVSFDALMQEADHLVIVLPYSANVHHIVDARALGLMKPSATLTNVGRGGLVDELALADALGAGRLAAAALDVFEHEPAVPQALLDRPNAVLTPHIGSATRTTRRAMARLAADNLIALAGGSDPLTAVNPQVLG
ncbi:MAG: 2-hydroxyacid dehydrogenase [Leptothrix ochracea]